ncbi:MAG TPA: ASKHA domain-containing protein, partial [Lacunisphaera sp.]|nr:ASKHA domain-containing protein [Lacunisphaera sp.]
DSSFENPQRFGGSDVMARIQYDTEDPTRTLQRTLVGYLARAIQEFPVDPRSIYEVIIAGNSTMRDLFFRLSVHSIGQSPYQSLTEIELAAGKRASTSLSDTARRLGLPIHPQARVHGLPVISGHVGADAAACMLAVDLPHEDRTIAVMDIGTNTELIVGNRHRVLAASCPAGPAFEGGQVTFGMPGLPGAIEKVAIAADGTVRTTVIGGGRPAGLCGSGLVDLLAELARTGRMNALGRFEHGAHDFVVDATGDQPVTFSESDINALAQAKGANVAGLQIAFAEYGISYADLDIFYLAGGFGRHLDIASAKRIGLIPNIDAAKIVQVGNASVEGACIALLSRAKRAELEEIVRRVVHCRLETHPGFFDYFVNGCQFAPVENNLEGKEP